MGAQFSQERVSESRIYSARQCERGQDGVLTRNGLMGAAEHALLPPDYPLTFGGPSWRVCISEDVYYGDLQNAKSKDEAELCKQQGKTPVSSSEMLLLDGSRQHLRAALDHARMGSIKDARFQLVELMDKMRSCYFMCLAPNYPVDMSWDFSKTSAVAHPRGVLSSCHQALFQLVLVKMCPGHFVGRVGQVVGKLCSGATKEVSALLQPRPQVLGPLGIMHLLEGVTNAILKWEEERDKMEAELMKLNQEAMKQLVQKETPVRAYIAGVHKTLLTGYEGVLGDKPYQHESLFSLRAVGCLQSGMNQQTIDICDDWLDYVGRGGHAVWANVLSAYAQLHLADRPRKLCQVADDLVNVIKLLEEHPEVQLASTALPGLPSDVQGYVRGIQTVVSGVRSTADAWDLALRLDGSAVAPGLGQAALAAVLADGVTSCTALLTSPHAALSMAATARILYFRARFYVRQREFSHALTDLAFSQSLNPMDDEVLQLWGDILVRLGATDALRELLKLTKSALHHHPRTAQDYVARSTVQDWADRQSCSLPLKGEFMSGQNPETKLSLDSYRLLCNNQMTMKVHGTRVKRMMRHTFSK
ncbi:hypothetical protein WJX82_001763 [Trebouxia sp. C0006]